MDLDTLIPLGQGGSGKVYRTADPKSGRTVAVKVIEPQGVVGHARVRREVAAQQALDHPNICALFELIEDDGDLLLMMEYIDGQPLDQAIAELDLDSRIQLLIDIAEGVVHAHERGVVHRDLKPGNVLVSEVIAPAGSQWIPKIVDFGIAQMDGAPTLTVAGQVMGTPAYMAPEQAMGVALIDRRVDIYALGAILYLMLTDRPAFAGTASEVISQLQAGTGVRPGKVRADVPPALERICLKAMALSPRRRYPHVRKLIDDLKAYQRGDTVAATGVWRWGLRRFWRRNRLLVTVFGVALVALLVSLTAVLVARGQAQQQARLAVEFASTAEQAATEFRLRQMVAGQDLAVARQTLNRTIQDIQDQANQLGDIARSPAATVIGRLQIELGQWQEAEQTLQQADQTAETSLLRGLALAALHRGAVRRAVNESVDDLRQQLLSDADQRYRQPAMRLLREAGSIDASTGTGWLAQGVLAMTDGRFDQAREHFSAALTDSPWRFEALQLVAESHETEMDAAILAGDWERVEQTRSLATQAYQRALAIAPSAASAHRRLCSMLADAVGVASYHQPEQVAQARRRSLEACNAAVANDSSSVQALTALATIHTFAARTAMRSGEDPSAYFQAAMLASEQALAIDDQNVAAWTRQASVQRLRSWEAMDADQSPLAFISSGRSAVQTALTIDPEDVSALNTAANLELDLAEWQLANGETPVAALDAAIDLLQRATRLRPTDDAPLVNLAIAHSIKVDYLLDAGEDANAAVSDALATYDLAEQLTPNDSFVFGARGVLLNHYAQHQADAGEDFEGSLGQAVRDVKKAAELSPNDSVRFYNLATVLRMASEMRWRYGGDWQPPLLEAINAIERALELRPEDADSQIMLARTLRLQVLARGQTGSAAQQTLQQAHDLLAGIERADFKDKPLTQLELEYAGMVLMPTDSSCEGMLTQFRDQVSELQQNSWSHRLDWLQQDLQSIRCDARPVDTDAE